MLALATLTGWIGLSAVRAEKPDSDLALLLPAEALVFVDCPSVESLERELPWAFPLFTERTLTAHLAEPFGGDESVLDRRGGASLLLTGGGVVVAARVRDAARARTAWQRSPAWKLAVSKRHAAWSSDPTYRAAGKAPAYSAGLPSGLLRGRIDLTRLLDEASAAAPQESGLIAAAREWVAAAGPIDFALRSEGAMLELDLSIASAPPGDGSDLGPLLRWLPGDAPILLAADADFGVLAAKLRKLSEFLQPGLPMPDLVAGRGYAASFALGPRGPEAIVVMRTRDPTRFVAGYAATLRGLAATPGAIVEVEEGADERVDGVPVRAFFIRPNRPGPDLPPGLPVEEDSILAFRVKGRPADVPTGWGEMDRAVVLRRLHILRGGIEPEVSGDDDYLFVAPPSRLAENELEPGEVEAFARAAVGTGGGVRLQRAVHPRHAAYAEFRKRLDEALASAGDDAPASVRIPPDDATRADFPRGVLWVTLGPRGKEEVNEGWRYRDRFLVSIAESDLSEADVAWAYLSTARLGARADTLDVAFRLTDGAWERASALQASDPGPPILVAVADGVLAGGVSIWEGEGECRGLPCEEAIALAMRLNGPPLCATYEIEGWKPRAFLRARQERAIAARVYGAKGIPVRAGTVGDLGFVVIGARDGLAAEVVAVLKDPARSQARALAADVPGTKGASFAARIDLLALLDQFGEFTAALSGDESSRFRGALPDGLAPLTLSGAREGKRFHMRLRADVKLFEFLAKQQEEQRLNGAKLRARALHMSVQAWMEGSGNMRLPTQDELERDPMLRYELEDPWGKRMRIEKTSGADGTFRVTSSGPDGRFGTEDDITSP